MRDFTNGKLYEFVYLSGYAFGADGYLFFLTEDNINHIIETANKYLKGTTLKFNNEDGFYTYNTLTKNKSVIKESDFYNVPVCDECKIQIMRGLYFRSYDNEDNTVQSYMCVDCLKLATVGIYKL